MAACRPINRWSQRVTETSDAMDLERGVFKKESPWAKDELRKLYGRPTQAETR